MIKNAAGLFGRGLIWIDRGLWIMIYHYSGVGMSVLSSVFFVLILTEGSEEMAIFATTPPHPRAPPAFFIPLNTTTGPYTLHQNHGGQWG